MLIKIKYDNNKFDMVKPWVLDRLIRKNRIKAFYRRTDWVSLGIDRMRSSENEINYQGIERRKKEPWDYMALLYLYLVLSYQNQL